MKPKPKTEPEVLRDIGTVYYLQRFLEEHNQNTFAKMKNDCEKELQKNKLLKELMKKHGFEIKVRPEVIIYTKVIPLKD